MILHRSLRVSHQGSMLTVCAHIATCLPGFTRAAVQGLLHRRADSIHSIASGQGGQLVKLQDTGTNTAPHVQLCFSPAADYLAVLAGYEHYSLFAAPSWRQMWQTELRSLQQEYCKRLGYEIQQLLSYHLGQESFLLVFQVHVVDQRQHRSLYLLTLSLETGTRSADCIVLIPAFSGAMCDRTIPESCTAKFSPSGRQMAVLIRQGTWEQPNQGNVATRLLVVDVASCTQLLLLSPIKEWVWGYLGYTIAWSPDEGTLAALGQLVHIRNGSSFALEEDLGYQIAGHVEGSRCNIGFNRSGCLLGYSVWTSESGGSHACFTDPMSGKEILRVAGHRFASFFATCARAVVVSDLSEESAQIWDVGHQSWLYTLDIGHSAWDLQNALDDRFFLGIFAQAGDRGQTVTCFTFWHASNGTIAYQCPCDGGAQIISPDENMLALLHCNVSPTATNLAWDENNYSVAVMQLSAKA